MKRNNMKWFCIPAVVTMVLVTACGGSGGSDGGSSLKSAVATENFAAGAVADSALYDYGYDDDAYEEEIEYDEAKSESGSQADQVKDSGRKLIKNYSIEAETKDFANLIGKVEAKVGALGGYVENCDTGVANYNKETRYARYVIRIPKERADEFVTAVEDASNVTNKSTSVEDVTLQYVDLESHRNALKTEQTRLLVLLDKAETVEDIITVEQRLSDVRYQLESMESQLRTYDNRIEYSTIRLNINEVEEISKPEEKTIGGRIKEGLADNFLNLVEAVVNFIIWLITGIPYWILLAVVILLTVVIVKACKKASAKHKKKVWEKQMQARAGQPVQQAAVQPMQQTGGQTPVGAEEKPADKEQ